MQDVIARIPRIFIERRVYNMPNISLKHIELAIEILRLINNVFELIMKFI
nr:MAG TPA: hypothetical protein [Caudoviricetes sp.]